METGKLRILWILFVFCILPRSSLSQQNNLFNTTPFQRQQARQPFQTQQQQRQLYPNSLGGINPLVPPLTTPLGNLNTLSPIVPTNPYRGYNQVNSQNFVPITAYQNELNLDGSFSYGYASADGTTAQAQGYVKNLGLGEAVEAQVVQGSYSYTSPEGTPITVRYIADENGFRAEGAHIPTPPPIPDAISKSLLYTGNVQSYQQNLSPNLNPYQTPYPQYPQGQNFRSGQQLIPLPQLQQQQQQQRFLQQQQQNSGQYRPENQFGQRLGTLAGVNNFGINSGQYQPGGLSNLNANLGQQQNLTQFQLQQQQQQALQQQQNLQKQQDQSSGQLGNEQQQAQQQQNQQQQLATQELRGRPNQLVNPFGYNQYRRFKKATKK